jgi:hypothetical protein
LDSSLFCHLCRLHIPSDCLACRLPSELLSRSHLKSHLVFLPSSDALYY